MAWQSCSCVWFGRQCLFGERVWVEVEQMEAGAARKQKQAGQRSQEHCTTTLACIKRLLIRFVFREHSNRHSKRSQWNGFSVIWESLLWLIRGFLSSLPLPFSPSLSLSSPSPFSVSCSLFPLSLSVKCSRMLVQFTSMRLKLLWHGTHFVV